MKRSYCTLLAAGLFVLTARAQTDLSGLVTGADDVPLDGARIVVGDEQVFGTWTDGEGRFVLRGLRSGALRLRCTFIGHVPMDTLLALAEGANSIVLLLRPDVVLMREAEVSALRAGDRSPFARSKITRDELDRINTGVDLPILLDLQPSVVTTTDAGTGIGYTGLRIRGSDASRINVTLNGVPVNDAESQAVFWVNMPDLAGGLEDIEIQRGVGTSTNGPGAFGGSINMRSTSLSREAFGELSAFGGSYNTQRYTARFGTGLMGEHFTLDGRLSSIRSDGYIDRASSDLKGYQVQAAWTGRRSSLRFFTMGGSEVTYQAWEGVPREVLDTNRTFNPYTYDNQVDDYRQTHYQLLFDRQLGADAVLGITLFRVLGTGFFEQYREDDGLARYGIAPIVVGDTTISHSDLIRRRWLDNAMDGVNVNLEQQLGAHRLVLGGSYSVYAGDHFGEVIWARWAGDSEIRDRYYFNDARKSDANTFAKLSYALSERLRLLGDVQLRAVAHDFLGFNNALDNVTQDASWTFFNPKAGAEWRAHQGGRIYASVAVGHREPNRSDLVESSPASRPRPEQVVDYEAGYERRGGRFASSLNLYYMDYTDQLVLTGELNDVGYALRTNVPRSHRAGAELTWALHATQRLTWKGNATFSQSTIANFTETLYDEETYAPTVIDHGTTDIAFSPELVAASELIFRVWNKVGHGHADLSLLTKYVGEQYLDNTSNAGRALDPYLVNDLRLNWVLTGIKGVKEFAIDLTVRNLFSELYESNGWVYSTTYEGGRNDYVSLFPQAPLNMLGGVTVRF